MSFGVTKKQLIFHRGATTMNYLAEKIHLYPMYPVSHDCERFLL